MKPQGQASAGISIRLDSVSMRFRFQWVFRNLSIDFRPGNTYALVGRNGAGKSTLVRILSGHLTPSRGKVLFESSAGHRIPPESVYRHISMTGPYMELIEEFTLVEAIRFHRRFKPFWDPLRDTDVLDLLELPKSSNKKEVRFFSSGMKQRLKLGLAILSQSDALFVDEPSTNLDRNATKWYHQLIHQFAGNRLLVVASNVEEDYSYCQHQIDVSV